MVHGMFFSAKKANLLKYINKLASKYYSYSGNAVNPQPKTHADSARHHYSYSGNAVNPQLPDILCDQKF